MRDRLVLLVVVPVFIVCMAATEIKANIGNFTPGLPGWSTQGTPYEVPGYWGDHMLELNAQSYNQSTSAFYVVKQDVSQFTASFVWFTGVGYDGYNPGDGFTFVVQNAGTGFLGSPGGGLGYGGMPNSAGFAFNLMSNSIALVQNGSIGSYSSINPVILHSLSGAARVTVTYDGSNLGATLVDTGSGASFHTNYSINIAQTIGSDMAYVGFTAGSGRAYGNQYVGDFAFNSVPEPATLLLLGLGGVMLKKFKSKS